MLDLGDIISQGLSQAGRPDLTTDAKTWIRLLLHQVYRHQDCTWNKKSQTDLAATNGLAVPSDYERSIGAYLGTTANNKVEIKITDDVREYRRLKAAYGSGTGTPVLIYVDKLNLQFQFVPTANTTYVWDLDYYHMPDLSLTELQDDDTVLWGLGDQVLIDYIFAKVMEYEDDSRAGKAEERVLGLLSAGKMNSQDSRGGTSQLRMGKSFRRGR